VSQIEKKLRLNEFYIIYVENKKPTINIVGLILKIYSSVVSFSSEINSNSMLEYLNVT
jgi:hypothetical protein